MPEQTWTIGQLINWTTDYFREQGVDSPRLDAEILLASARDCRRIDLYASFEEIADEATRAGFREMVRRRAAGAPVAYLVGRREFYSLEFEVSPAVLIPRPETELVVMTLVDLVRGRETLDDRIDIADIGTGSGVLAICAARHLPAAHVVATDTSAAALEVARRNAARHDVVPRIEFVQCDLMTLLPESARFDYIVSNPPYVASAEMNLLPVEVKDYEPHEALHGGQAGTEVIQKLMVQAVDRLRPGGVMLVEISPMIAARVEQLVAATSGLEFEQTIPDTAGHARVVQASKSAT